MEKKKILALLKSEGAEMETLFQEAREVRQACFADQVFLYGFVYFSTWCRNNCSFCYYRTDNDVERYRKTKEEIYQIAASLAETGVHLIDLTMGEDAVYHSEDFATVLEIIREIKTQTGKPVMISPGVVSHETIREFARAGADWYALYQETHNEALFRKLRLEQSYQERMGAKLFARQSGMLIEEGIMTGIGESLEDIADSILTMGRIGASQMRVMSFIPQQGSPMASVEMPDISLELKIIAILRILYPTALIPASLDIEGIHGLKNRIAAGANVVTSIIPPNTGLVGVAQSKMDVDEGGRTAREAAEILAGMGLRPASQEVYDAFLEAQKRALTELSKSVV